MRVVLPASGWLMIAKVRLLAASRLTEAWLSALTLKMPTRRACHCLLQPPENESLRAPNTLIARSGDDRLGMLDQSNGVCARLRDLTGGGPLSEQLGTCLPSRRAQRVSGGGLMKEK